MWHSDQHSTAIIALSCIKTQQNKQVENKNKFTMYPQPTTVTSRNFATASNGHATSSYFSRVCSMQMHCTNTNHKTVEALRNINWTTKQSITNRAGNEIQLTWAYVALADSWTWKVASATKRCMHYLPSKNNKCSNRISSKCFSDRILRIIAQFCLHNSITYKLMHRKNNKCRNMVPHFEHFYVFWKQTPINGYRKTRSTSAH